MANTYVGIYIHLVFAVKYREALLPAVIHNRVYGYMGKVVNEQGCKLISIGGPDNHVHLLISLGPTVRLSDLVRDIKAKSSKFINAERLLRYRFEWQTGYAALSYSKGQLPQVCNYIENQMEHHKGRSLQEEIKAILEMSGIDYEDEYIFYDA